MLLTILIAVPLAGALIMSLMRERSINIPFIASAIVLAMGGFTIRDVFRGMSLTYKMDLTGPFTLALHMDPLSAVFVVLAAFLWLVVSIYAPDYMKYEGRKKGYEICTLFTLTAVLGVFLAGNLLTMLLFFELMTVVSYFWVVHRWDKGAIKAGYFYLFFSIIGGLFIALGIVLMGISTDVPLNIGVGSITPLNPRFFAWSIVLFVIGFGIKAGMAPLHLWLPHAHSAAPTPSSALLSGLLIKVGAYGLIRVGEFAGWGTRLGSEVSWLGPSLAILGICTMLIGVVAALLQSDAKRLLAYHSVSQMGYIILGLGIGLYLGLDGGLGLMGSIYHIVNHALFKVALFLGVGIIYIHSKETNLYKLGGLRRRFPITAILMFLAVLGITGTPGLNGYASKTLLHHGVSLAAEGGVAWVIWVERLFLLVGVGTAASFAKLYYLIFLGEPTKIKVSDDRFPRMQISMGLLVLVMIVIGLVPKLFPNIIAVPVSRALGMEDAAASLVNFSFWNLSDVMGMVITLALGILVCWMGLRTGAFHWTPPIWLTLEGLGKLNGMGIIYIFQKLEKTFCYLTTDIWEVIKTISSRLCLTLNKFNKSRNGTVGGATLTGISADAALLVLALVLLIIWYTLTHPGLASM
ncbi:MAG: proton-conducting membrane transporter [Epulopiscium sp.]|nr:proton-conducting membrane transporter [Candidatus Epulonipiscium sp.]